MRDNQTITTAIIIAIAVIIIGIFGPTIIQLLFCIGESTPIILSNRFESSDILEYFGIVLSLLGTLFLGGITLWQNQRFKDENDSAQNNLNNAVERLAQANKIIADDNTQLVALEKQNQKIQLILAQEYIPFLEVRHFGYWSVEKTNRPIYESFSINQSASIEDVTFSDKTYKNAINYQVDIFRLNEYSPQSNDYLKLHFYITFLNETKSMISKIYFTYVKLFNNGSLSITITNNQNSDYYEALPPFSVYNLNGFVFDVVTHSDNEAAMKHLELGIKIITSTGVEFSEVITIKNPSDKDLRQITYKFQNGIE